MTNGESEQLRSEPSKDTANEFLVRATFGDDVTEQTRQLCESVWDAGWYSSASGIQIDNPFRGEKGLRGR